MSILTEGLAFGDLCVFDVSPYYRDAQMYHVGQMHEKMDAHIFLLMKL